MGIVYGDIGTSPLYAFRECFSGPHAIPVSPANILGVLSLILWSLIVVVTVKYLLYILRADNKGEGGILALMSLVRSPDGGRPRYGFVAVLGLFGAALLYGDGMITPAISVLSAIEGLGVATPLCQPYIIPITVLILVGLFAAQRHGTERVGIVFGPVILVWFLVIGALGVISLIRTPAVLAAANPAYALRFFAVNGTAGFFVLGAVFLVVTGSEALYADLGHFSRRPIYLSWFLAAGPALALNYCGQGALLLRSPAAAHNPFFRMVPSWGLYPLVALSAAATVIASQAVITGAFSLTRQAVQLGYLPRLAIVHTSDRESGQIYVPLVNWMLLAATITLVFAFRSSSGLAAAYGIAVSLTMVITTLLAFLVARRRWRWNLPAAAALTALFLAVDLAFLTANLAKIKEGGWVPLLISALIVFLFVVWRQGQAVMRERRRAESLPLIDFVRDAESSAVVRVPGHAVILNKNLEWTPRALLHNIKHNKVLHENNLFVTVVNEETPHIAEAERYRIENLGGKMFRVTVRYGFMESSDLFAALYRACEDKQLLINPLTATYITSRDTVVEGRFGRLPVWQLALYRFMYRNALRPALFFGLPPNRVIEIGRQVEI